jgi:hypothetical protein
MYADPHRLGELRLSKADEPPQCRDVGALFELAQHQALADAGGDGAGEILLGEPHRGTLGPNPAHQQRST